MPSKDFKTIVEEAEKQGFRIDYRKGGRVMFYSPDKAKPVVTAHQTPSDHRALDNLIAQLRRSGFIWKK